MKYNYVKYIQEIAEIEAKDNTEPLDIGLKIPDNEFHRCVFEEFVELDTDI